MNTKFKSEIVKNYLRRFPESPTRTIARKIYTENVEDFMSEEDARGMVKYYRGLMSEKRRAKVADKELFIKKGTFSENPFKLPRSKAKKST